MKFLGISIPSEDCHKLYDLTALKNVNVLITFCKNKSIFSEMPLVVQYNPRTTSRTAFERGEPMRARRCDYSTGSALRQKENNSYAPNCAVRGNNNNSLGRCSFVSLSEYF